MTTGRYVFRPILNVAPLAAWAAAQGIPPLDADLHVTILYTRDDIPWTLDPEPLEVEVTEASMLGEDQAAVLFVEAPELEVRHWYAREELGATCKHETYRPHMTLYYARGLPRELPDFPLQLGPEQSEPLGAEDSFSELETPLQGTASEDDQKLDEARVLRKGGASGRGYNPNRKPAGGPGGGQFTGPGTAGTGYSLVKGQWVTKGGVKASAATVVRMKALAIPPAWKDVRLNPDLKAGLQALGVDSKGRTQPRYSVEFRGERDAAKFERLKSFNAALPKGRAAISRALRGPDGPTREAAAALRLIDRTAFRVGSERDTGADKQAYGATTLRAEHLTIKGDTLTFEFTGKKGVTIRHQITDPELATFLRPRKAAGGQLFNTSDRTLRLFIKAHMGPSFMVKDFRTHSATHTALKLISKMKPVSDEKSFKRVQKAVATQVATHLGNTPAMALKAYIDPVVWPRLWRKYRAA